MENEIKMIATAINGSTDPYTSKHSLSLTEAVMGMTDALVRIADELEKNNRQRNRLSLARSNR